MSKIVFNADSIRKTVTIKLPSVPGSEIEFYIDNVVGAERVLTTQYPNYQDQNHPDAFSFVMASLCGLVKAWNFTDTAEQDIPVSEASNIFEKIPSPDIKYILTELEKARKDTLWATGEVGLVQ